MIVVDAMHRDALSCYCGSTPTPKIDVLSIGGHMFPNAVAPFHQTTISMAANLTAHTPSIESCQKDGTLLFTSQT